MSKSLSVMACAISAMSIGMSSAIAAIEIDSASNEVFDLYYFGNGDVGIFGTPTGVTWQDEPRQTSGNVKDSTTYYWGPEMKQAMLNAVNTWTDTIATPYDTTKHARKLRIGFFLDDASVPGGVMTISMAGYATTQTVTTKFEPEYGATTNIYSVAEWAWRDNKETANYNPSWATSGAYWESNILADGANSIDIAIVLNPIVTSYGFDAQGNFYRNEIARTAEEMQNIATHEIGHGMGVDSWLYTQLYDGTTQTSYAGLSGYVSTWDTLLTLDGKHLVTVTDGMIAAEYSTLAALQAAGWECAPGKDPADPNSYTMNEIQYDPARRLSLEGEVGVHIAAQMLEGDTLEHVSYGDGTNVLGPGGTANSTFTEADLRALELLGWSVHRNETPAIPEPTTATLSLLALAGLAARRRR